MKRTIMLGMAMLGLSALAVGCKKGADASAGAAMQMPPAKVTAAVATAQDVPVYLDEIGRTVSIDVVSIVPQVGGKLQALPGG